jgi:hypothetical protein
MKPNGNDHSIDPVGSTVASVQVLATKMRIRDLCIERPDVVSYLQTIQPEKQEIALVHAIEVGIAEIVARRERFLLGAAERGGARTR